MSVKFPVKISFEAVDRLTGTVNDINRKLEKVAQPGRIMGRKLGGLGEALRLKDLGEKFGTVRSAASDLRSEISGAALAAAGLVATVVGGSFALVKGFAEAADNIGDTAARLGISTSALQEYRFAAKIAGVEQEGFDKALQKLGQHLAESSVGMGEALPVFEALGIGTKDATGKVRSLESVLPELADKFQKIGSESVRNALAVKLFGKEGAKMSVLLKDGASGVEALRKEARDLGGVIGSDMVKRAGDFGDTIDKMKFALGGVRNVIAEQLLPVFEGLSVEFLAFVKTHKQDFVELGQAIKLVLVEVLAGVKVAFGVFMEAVKAFNGLSMEKKVWLIHGALVAFGALILGPVVSAVFTLVSALGSLILSTSLWTVVGSVALGVLKVLSFGFGLLWNAVLFGTRVIQGLVLVFRVMSLLFGATPFGLVILAVTALIALTYALIKNWDAVKEWFLSVPDMIQSAWGGLKEWFVTLWNDPMTALKQYVDFYIGSFKKIWDIAKLIGSKLGFGSDSLTINGPAAGGASALNAINASQTNRNETRVEVDFANVPRGTQVQTSSQTGTPVNLNLGYAGVFR